MTKFKLGDIVVVCSNSREKNNRLSKFLYEFGYYTKYGCVVYIKGCRNMQDSYAFKINKVKRATKKDKEKLYYGK